MSFTFLELQNLINCIIIFSSLGLSINSENSYTSFNLLLVQNHNLKISRSFRDRVMKAVESKLIILHFFINMFSMSMFLLNDFSLSDSWPLSSKSALNLFSVLNSLEHTFTFNHFLQVSKFNFLDLISFHIISNELLHFISLLWVFNWCRFFTLFFFYELSVNLHSRILKNGNMTIIFDKISFISTLWVVSISISHIS